MLVTNATPQSTPQRIAPGATLGFANARPSAAGDAASSRARIPVTAGQTLLSGVRDIRAAAQELINDHWLDPAAPRRVSGLVAFVRIGDAWDAVEMLAHDDRTGVAQPIWAPWSDMSFQPSSEVVIDDVWQISAYGHPAMDLV